MSVHKMTLTAAEKIHFHPKFTIWLSRKFRSMLTPEKIFVETERLWRLSHDEDEFNDDSPCEFFEHGLEAQRAARRRLRNAAAGWLAEEFLKEYSIRPPKSTLPARRTKGDTDGPAAPTP